MPVCATSTSLSVACGTYEGVNVHNAHGPQVLVAQKQPYLMPYSQPAYQALWTLARLALLWCYCAVAAATGRTLDTRLYDPVL